MKGTITELDHDKIRGKIESEGTIYFFQEFSLKDGIKFESLKENDTVYFQPKEKTDSNGYKRFFANKISKEPPYEIRHSNGDFKNFIYIDSYKLVPQLQLCAKNFFSSDDVENMCSQAWSFIAKHYNSLSDSDFLIDETEGILRFPSGIDTDDGKPIILVCKKNWLNRQKWACFDIEYEGMTRVFKYVNAKWRDIWEDLKVLFGDSIPVAEKDLSNKIEARNPNFNDFVFLDSKGSVVSEETAAELYVPTGFEYRNAELYMFFTKKNSSRTNGWYYNCITYEGAGLEVYKKKNWLSLWCSFDSHALEILSNMTLEEKWSFGNNGYGYGILFNYLRYTFALLYKQGQVITKGNIAVFNTGLPDRNTYSYIYAFCKKIDSNPSVHSLHFQPEYRFMEFVLSGRGGNGKIVGGINPLPAPPKYFNSRSDTVWELSLNSSNQIEDPQIDDTHILITRCERIPLDFFRDAKCAEIDDILASEDDEAKKYSRIKDLLRPIIEYTASYEISNAYNNLSGKLAIIIKTAMKRLSWNWRAVVPCYNPEEEKFCFLLPISFSGNPEKPDRAMVATAEEFANEHTRYAIHTIIPRNWAYLDARLVCRPESEWLVPEMISGNADDDDAV